jgi:hypothetical protein
MVTVGNRSKYFVENPVHVMYGLVTLFLSPYDHATNANHLKPSCQNLLVRLLGQSGLSL